MYDTNSQITLSSNVDGSLEGQYIKIMQDKNKMVGKVLLVTGNHTMTVKWYSRWQWFWVSVGLSCRQWATQLRLHLTAFGEDTQAQFARFVSYIQSLLSRIGGK
jgi:hypothetical protein